MGLFDKITGLLGTVVGKLGPAGALVPMLLDLLQTKMNDDDADGVRVVAGEFKDVGAKFTRLGELLEQAVDPDGPGGDDITGTEYARLSGELLQLADELADLPESIKNL